MMWNKSTYGAKKSKKDISDKFEAIEEQVIGVNNMYNQWEVSINFSK